MSDSICFTLRPCSAIAAVLISGSESVNTPSISKITARILGVIFVFSMAVNHIQNIHPCEAAIKAISFSGLTSSIRGRGMAYNPSHEPSFSNHKIYLSHPGHFALPGNPHCGIGFDSHHLSWDLLWLHRWSIAMCMVGVCKEWDVLDIVSVHTVVHVGIGCVVDHGSLAVHCRNEAKTKK